MNYKITNKSAEVTITNLDVDDKATSENIYSYLPQEVQDFYYANKNKPNFNETRVNGRARFEDKVIDGFTVYFELT